MQTLPLDPQTEDALLEGRLEVAEIPAAWREVAALLAAARPKELSGQVGIEDDVVAAFVAATRQSAFTTIATDGSRRAPRRRLSTKFVGAAAASMMLLGGGVAAATGSLPASMQSALSHFVSHVGISIPAGHSKSTPGTHGQQGLPGNSAYGLCTAYNSIVSGPQGTSSPALQSTAFRRLDAVATAKGDTVAGFCATIPHPGKSGGTHGQSGGSHGQSGGTHGQSGGSHGQSGGSHGQSGGSHGQSGGTHGQSGGTHGQSGGTHGQSGGKSGSSNGKSGGSSHGGPGQNSSHIGHPSGKGQSH